MKEVRKKYLNNEIKLEKWQKIGIICLIIVLSGIFGWIYEYIFYFFNSGMKKFYWRGGNFLPWINIYATGSLMIMFLTKKFKKNPLLIFLIAFLSTGILEYIAGFGVYHFTHMRYWDYNTEILNFGNIDGFVCLRSAGFFGLSAIFLINVMVPFCIYLSTKMNKKTFLILSITVCALFIADEIYNLVIARIFNLSRASSIYKKLGLKYMNYSR